MTSKEKEAQLDALIQKVVALETKMELTRDTRMDIDDKVKQLYTVFDKVGQGTFGIVWKGMDVVTNEVVAIKKIPDAFLDINVAKGVTRETLYLKQLEKHENIIDLLEVIVAENETDIYLVFPFVPFTLHATIRTGELGYSHIQYIMYQLLKGVKFLHSAGVIHRDLKSDNILMDDTCFIQIADMGSSRSITSLSGYNAPDLSTYMTTRWYRAPETILDDSHYSKAIDMWSIGCIFAEMMLEECFLQGANARHQLELILQLIGKPAQQDIDLMDPHIAKKLRSYKKYTPTWDAQFPDIDPVALDLLKQLLKFDPKNRLTAHQALDHTYLKDYGCGILAPRHLKPIECFLDTQEFAKPYDVRSRFKAELNALS